MALSEWDRDSSDSEEEEPWKSSLDTPSFMTRGEISESINVLFDAELFDKLIAVYAITGIIMLFFILFSILGKRKLEKELE